MSMKCLMARMACHTEAVKAARLAGMTWMEIGDRLGINGEAARKAYARALAAMRSERLVPLEQTPLPEPPELTPVPAPAAQPAAKPKPYLSEDHEAEKRPERTGFKHIKLS